ncbi:conjugal transfer protein TraX [Pseudomonas sp. 5P_5.1_Bac1]|uniref:conjugal transfer protein TraX n=1 Tax=Pseudomonas sp. 5P_5.1_Bac1 TaxID=2971616 RepID=UPI0021C9BA33|nr:conjugal transfer protein TraX [Pseudomonas sp. 5P_5.1_Bac1]MCU1719981.1 conjugal transfer protein TraX [Pseudomonas sp. 5P_5.1_Bac1]
MARPVRSASLDLLKWLAIVTMVGDHLRYLWPEQHWLFVVGRLAFPFFCLAIAANVARALPGTLFTAVNLRYLGWCLGFSLLSELPYRWLDSGSPTLNVMPTLTLGLLVAWGVHHRTRQAGLLALAALLVAVFTSDRLMYGWPGVLLPAAFVLALHDRRYMWLAGALAVGGNLTNGWILHNALQPISIVVLATAFLCAPFGLGLLRMDVRRAVRPVGRWGYAFYPLHLAVIKLLSVFS